MMGKLSALVLMLIFWLPANSARAQSGDAELTRFVPPGTFMFFSINYESLLQDLSSDHPVIKAYRERDNFSTADFLGMAHGLYMVTNDEQVRTEEYSIPIASVCRYLDDVTDVNIKKSMSSTNMMMLDFESKQHGDYELQVGNWDQADSEVFVSGVSAPSYFLPGDNVFIHGTGDLLRLMIDEEQEDSAGREFVSGVDQDYALHIKLKGGENLTSIPMFSLMFGDGGGASPADLVGEVKKAEIVVNFEDMIPVKVTVEMNSSESAENLEQLVKQGLKMAPAAIDMANNYLDNAGDSERDEFGSFEGELKALLALGRQAAADLDVSRDGATLELQLANIDGLDKLGSHLMVLYAAQHLLSERFMEEMEEMEAGPSRGDDWKELDLDDGPEGTAIEVGKRSWNLEAKSSDVQKTEKNEKKDK